jgi:hypothetical protein
MSTPAANRLARRANLYRSSLVITPAVPTAAAPGRRRWLGLAVLSLGVSMIIVDATVVNVAIPTIIGDLGLQGTDAEWLNTI